MIEWCKMRISIKPTSYFEEKDNLLFYNFLYKQIFTRHLKKIVICA